MTQTQLSIGELVRVTWRTHICAYLHTMDVRTKEETEGQIREEGQGGKVDGEKRREGGEVERRVQRTYKTKD